MEKQREERLRKKELRKAELKEAKRKKKLLETRSKLGQSYAETLQRGSGPGEAGGQSVCQNTAPRLNRGGSSFAGHCPFGSTSAGGPPLKRSW